MTTTVVLTTTMLMVMMMIIRKRWKILTLRFLLTKTKDAVDYVNFDMMIVTELMRLIRKIKDH